jgi:hypothetical protein
MFENPIIGCSITCVRATGLFEAASTTVPLMLPGESCAQPIQTATKAIAANLIEEPRLIAVQ